MVQYFYTIFYILSAVLSSTTTNGVYLYQYPHYYVPHLHDNSSKLIATYADDCIMVQHYFPHRNITSFCRQNDNKSYNSFAAGYSFCIQHIDCHSMLYQIIYSVNSTTNHSALTYLSFLYNDLATQSTDIVPFTSFELRSSMRSFLRITNIHCVYIELQRLPTEYIWNAKQVFEKNLINSNCLFMYLNFTSLTSESYGSSFIDFSMHLDDNSSVYSYGILDLSASDIVLQCVPPGEYILSVDCDATHGNIAWEAVWGFDHCINDFAAHYYQIDDGYASGASSCVNDTISVHIEDDFTLSYRVSKIQTFLKTFSVIDLSDGWIIFVLVCTNIISAMFICIGILMYHKNVGFKSSHVYSWIAYICLLILVLITSFRSYLYYDRCLSRKAFMFVMKEDGFDAWLISYFTCLWLLSFSWNFMLFSGDISSLWNAAQSVLDKLISKKTYIAIVCSMILLLCSSPYFIRFVGNCCDFTADPQLKITLIWALFIPQLIPCLLSPLCLHILLIDLGVAFEIFVTETFGITIGALLWVMIVFILMISTFFLSQDLRPFKISIASIYLVTFDLLTDFLLIYEWIVGKSYAFAALQVLFIAIGQLFIAENGAKVSVCDRMMTICGFGRVWLGIKVWSDPKYIADFEKLKFWEIMCESFPSVALQLYVVLASAQYKTAIVQSIIATYLSISFSVWKELLSKTVEPKQQMKQAENIESDDGMIDKMRETLKSYSKIIGNPVAFSSIYCFMVSDFYCRTFPFVAILAYCSRMKLYIEEIVVGTILFVVFALFQFVLCKWMRVEKHRQNKEILSIFLVSTISSFYNLLCCIADLKDIPFFDQSVYGDRFLCGHILRMIISLLMFLVYIVFIFNSDLSFSIVFVMLFVINCMSLHGIRKYIAPSCTIGNIMKEYSSLSRFVRRK